MSFMHLSKNDIALVNDLFAFSLVGDFAFRTYDFIVAKLSGVRRRFGLVEVVRALC